MHHSYNVCFFLPCLLQLRVVQEIDDDLAHSIQKEDTNSTSCDNQSSQQQQQQQQSPRNSALLRSRSRGTSFLSAMGLQTRPSSHHNNNSSHNNNNSHKNMEHLREVRAKCVEELLNTEKDYVTMLRNIIEVIWCLDILKHIFLCVWDCKVLKDVYI